MRLIMFICGVLTLAVGTFKMSDPNVKDLIAGVIYFGFIAFMIGFPVWLEFIEK